MIGEEMSVLIRGLKHGAFSERESMEDVLTWAYAAVPDDSRAAVTTAVMMASNTILEAVAAYVEDWEPPKYQPWDYYLDTAIAIMEHVPKLESSADRPKVALLAKVFDDAWDALPQELSDQNAECWDIEIVPDMLEEWWVDNIPTQEVVLEYLVRRMQEAHEEDEDYEYDGQPTEQEEWHDFDPDC